MNGERHITSNEKVPKVLVDEVDLGRHGCLLAQLDSYLQQTTLPDELVVCDDASTDATARIAEQAGARTLRVEHRKISAVRNAGARAASGEIFFFVDADTQVNEQAVSAALAALRSGAAGGGCLFGLSGPLPLWGRAIYLLALIPGRLLGYAGQ